MPEVKPCNSYAARPSGIARYGCGPTAYKIYYVDIYGRSQPERYEWDLCDLPRESVLAHLKRVQLEGVGAVVAFPHITKVFRFAPSAETIMHVRGFWTPDLSEVDLNREDGFVEFACYAEAIIAAEEYRFWAEATSVAAYLERWVEWDDAPVVDNAKLARHFGTSGA